MSERNEKQGKEELMKEVTNMIKLSRRERELVAIGAAIGSNCIPCVEYHISIARKEGITDAQILEAIEFANKVKEVSAKKVCEEAKKLISADVIPEQESLCCGPNEKNNSIAGKCC